MLRFVFTLILFCHSLVACTGITLKAKDGSTIYARTLEFGINKIPFDVIFVPRGMNYQGTTPNGKAGVTWTNKYAFVGANPFHLPQIADGVNEKSLSVGLFYFPGYADYTPFEPSTADQALAPWEFGTWILSLFSTVDEVKEHLNEVTIVPTIKKEMGMTLPLHYIVHDAKGHCIVIEPVDGKLVVHDNPLGVFTNSPTFDWQMTNLENYVNLSAFSAKPISLATGKLVGFGQGTGMLGLPGDFTPPSRFVRATALVETSIPLKNSEDALAQAFHILDSFDIPEGSVRQMEKGKVSYEITVFTSAIDLLNRKFYFHTFGNRNVRVVGLDQFDKESKEIWQITMDTKGAAEDVRSQAKPFSESKSH